MEGEVENNRTEVSRGARWQRRRRQKEVLCSVCRCLGQRRRRPRGHRKCVRTGTMGQAGREGRQETRKWAQNGRGRDGVVGQKERVGRE